MPGSCSTSYQGLVFSSLANRLDGLYPITRGDCAKLTYQLTQSPFAVPVRSSFTRGLALMNTSPRRSRPLIWLARPFDPPAKPWNLSPVVLSNAGPTPCSISFTRIKDNNRLGRSKAGYRDRQESCAQQRDRKPTHANSPHCQVIASTVRLVS